MFPYKKVVGEQHFVVEAHTSAGCNGNRDIFRDLVALNIEEARKLGVYAIMQRYTHLLNKPCDMTPA